MGCLPQPQWEKFAIELVELQLSGDKHARVKAYERAGYAANQAPNARRLANRPEVKKRVQELFTEACEYRNIRAVTLVVRLDRISRANVADYFERDPQSGKLTLKDITTLPREFSEAIESIKWNADGAPELKLCDKEAATFTLLKHFGGLPEPEAPRTQVNVFNALSLDDQAALADLIEALPGGSKAAGDQAAVEHDPGGAAP